MTDLEIKFKYSYHGHSQAYEQVETTNKMFLRILKKKLINMKGNWVEELPEILWA